MEDKIFKVKEGALNVLVEALNISYSGTTLDVLRSYIGNNVEEIKEEKEDGGE